MGKFCFPSCCCFSSSSSPQEVNIVVHSTQPSQQPANSGPSTPLLSSQPSQQPTSAGHSTPSSSSQPSQQPVNAGPSTATNVDLESFLQKINDISQLHNLIQFIDELLKRVERKEEGSSSAASSYIQDGQTILELVDKHISKIPQKNDSKDGASAEIEKVVINLLKGAAQIHWVGAALSVVGFVLARYNEMSNNQRECLEILKVLFNLGKQILKLNEQMPEEKEKLNEAVKCIVQGCIICASQLATGKFVRFLTASVNAEGLKGFQDKIGRLYDDLTLSAVINMHDRIPKIAPELKAAYKPAVGIEIAQETVIQLLDLNAQHTSSQLVVVYGFGGIGKTTLADAVYDHVDPQIYKKCRIHMDQHCTEDHIKVLQELALEKLFNKKVQLTDCDHGRQTIWGFLEKNPDQPVFLYIDNGLKSRDLELLLPGDLGGCLPPRSRLLVTTRNLQETDMFVYWNVQRQQYRVNPLPETEARKILLKRATDHNDEKHIQDLLKLCDGVPLLLALAGAQLAKNPKYTKNMVLELLKAGEEVKDISDCMVDFVYDRLLQPVKEAFLDLVAFFYHGPRTHVSQVDSIGEEELEALQEASFIERDERGFITIHDIIEARGKKMSEQNRITDPEALLDCLKDEQKLKNLKGISFRGEREQPPIEISDDHLKCMSNSLRVLSYEDGSQITFRKKCHKPFKELRFLKIPRDSSDLPMEFEKHENLAYYSGPFTQAMSLYELPPSLRFMFIEVSAENGVTDSKVPPRVTSASSLVKLFCDLNNMQMLPDGIEKLTKLERLYVKGCHQLRKFPPDYAQLSNLKELGVDGCSTLSEFPYSFGQLNNLEYLRLQGCSALSELPCSFGQLNNLKYLRLEGCSALSTLPSEFVLLKNLQRLYLDNCSGLKELPCDIGQLKNLSYLNLRGCSGLKEWPLSLGDLIRKGCYIVSD